MKRPHVYGNEAKLRAALARYLERADDLLAQAGGVRKRIAGLPSDAEGSAFFIEAEWAKGVRHWFSLARRTISPYLQEQLEAAMPVLALGLPADTGKPRHTIRLDNGEPWLRKAREEMKAVQAAFGVSRGIARAAPPPARFAELHASGLVGEKVGNDYAKEMLNPRIPKQLGDAIWVGQGAG